MAASDSSGAKRAREQSERFRESMERIRSRTESGSKLLGTVATAAITGLGYEKLADVFPYHGPWWALVAVALGVAAMIAAAAYLIYGFRRASWSIITNADSGKTIVANELDSDEGEILLRAYQAVAGVSEASSLLDLEQRGRRLERCAEQDDQKAARLAKQADRILTEVQLAQDRAATFILRRRATRALFSFAAAAYVSLFVLGWYGLALGADAMESKRNDEVELVKKCGEARKAVGFADVELPSACGDDVEAPSSEEIAAGAKAALADAKKACRQAAKGGNGDEAECDSLVLAKPETETE